MMKNKQLIVNADDYGVTENVSKGIREANLSGIVTSTSAMMNGKSVVHDLILAQENCPKLGLGIHLVISAGFPVLHSSKVKTLVDSSGRFINIRDIQTRFDYINYNEIKDEWRAQIELFLSTGATLDHLDSHHNVSYINEEIFSVMADLASEYQIPVRHPYAPIELDAGNISDEVIVLIKKFVPRIVFEEKVKFPNHFISTFFRSGASLDNLLSILRDLSGGTSELMCHPGYSDNELKIQSSYNSTREVELMILMNSEVKEAVKIYDIELINYKNI